MFTPGRIAFVIIFTVVFIIGMIYAYRKDLKYEKLWYSGAWKILLIALAIVAAYFLFTKL